MLGVVTILGCASKGSHAKAMQSSFTVLSTTCTASLLNISFLRFQANVACFLSFSYVNLNHVILRSFVKFYLFLIDFFIGRFSSMLFAFLSWENLLLLLLYKFYCVVFYRLIHLNSGVYCYAPELVFVIC